MDTDSFPLLAIDADGVLMRPGDKALALGPSAVGKKGFLEEPEKLDDEHNPQRQNSPNHDFLEMR